MSLYWRSADITDPALRARADELLDGTAELRLAACETMLGSGDPVAAGIAADSYFAACAEERWGVPNPFDDSAELLRAWALATLAEPPMTATNDDGTVTTGANHASALGVLARAGHGADARLLVPFLRVADVNVLSTACMAANHCLGSADWSVPVAAVVEALEALALDPGRDDEVRAATVSALGARDSEESHETQDALVRIALAAGAQVAADAAWQLMHLDLAVYEALLRERVAAWAGEDGWQLAAIRDTLARLDTRRAEVARLSR
jgi:hypothetical protein